MNKKYNAALVATAMVASSLFAVSAFADTTAQAPLPHKEMEHGSGMGGIRRGGMMDRGMIGTVASVNGTTFTLTVKERVRKEDASQTAPSTTYTVDASKATVMKNGSASTENVIAVGDTVMVMGPVSGTTVTANRIMDGLPPMGERKNEDKQDKQKEGDEKNDAPVFTGNGQPVVAGSVTSIAGSVVTITNKSNVTFTIDTTNAKIEKTGAAATISDIAVGDMIVAQGAVNGSNVTASTVMDQGVKPAEVSTPTTQPQNPPARKGVFGAIGGFFGKIFGF